MPSVKRRHREGFNPGTPVPRAGRAAWGEFEIPNAPVGGGLNYGPVVGGLTGAAAVAAVKANTAPHAVTEPGYVTTHIFSTDDTAAIRTKVRAAATAAGQNAVVYFHKGLYNVTGSGDPNKVVLRMNPWADGMTLVFESAAGYVRTAGDSAVWDGGGGAISCMIYGNQERGPTTDPGTPHPKNITVRGGCFQNTGPDGDLYHSWAGCVTLNGPGHTVEDAIVQNYWNSGFLMTAYWAPNTSWAGSPWPALGYPAPTAPSGDNTYRRCYAYRCGTSGFMGKTDTYNHGTFKVLNCRAQQNCQRGNGVKPYADVVGVDNNHGNTKFFINNALFDGNWVHDSISIGLWNDWYHFNTIYTNNVIEDNAMPGMFLEAEIGGTVVQHNYFKNNGHGAGPYTTRFAVPHLCGNLQLTVSDATLDVMSLWPLDTGNYPTSAPQVGTSLEIDVSYNLMDNYGDGDPSYPPGRGEYMFKGPHPINISIDNYNRSATNRMSKAIKVHHNQFWIRGTGWSNWKGVSMATPTDPEYSAAALDIWSQLSNEYYSNEYHVSSLTARNWVWWRQFGSPTYPVNDYQIWEDWVGATRNVGGGSMNHEVGSSRVLI